MDNYNYKNEQHKIDHMCYNVKVLCLDAQNEYEKFKEYSIPKKLVKISQGYVYHQYINWYCYYMDYDKYKLYNLAYNVSNFNKNKDTSDILK